MFREEYLDAASGCAVYGQLRKEIKGRYNCAYLFEGQDVLLSKCVAALLACDSAADPAAAKKKLLGGNLVDLLFFGENGLRKDDAESIIASGQSSPVELPMKYYVLDFTDAGESVQNKLLKTLEDVPATCVFFIISSGPSDTLATVKSRCKTYYPAVGADALRSLIKETDEPVVKCFGINSVTMYNYIKYENGARTVQNAVNYINYIGKPSGALSAVSLLPKERAGFKEHFLYVELILGMVISSYGNGGVSSFGAFNLEEIKNKFGRKGAVSAARIIRGLLPRTADANLTSLADLITLKLTEVAENVKGSRG